MIDLSKYNKLAKEAVEVFWNTRNSQQNSEDATSRSAVTGGKQLDGFLQLLSKIACDTGIPQECIYTKNSHLPGYFRPTKEWDMLIISPSKKLIATVELKSQVGSFGNNFNNRTEEAIGSAVDMWTAFRENVYPNQSAPWVGYIVVVEKTDKSTSSVKIAEPHFKAFDNFYNTSYLDRYKILCQKLMLERFYSQCCLIWTNSNYEFGSKSEDTSIDSFLYSFIGHLTGQLHEFR